MFLGWSQIFNSKIAIKTRTICRGVWNLPHKFHLYLIYICQLKINRICFRHFESRHFQVLTIKCQVLGFFNLFRDFLNQNQNLAFSGLGIFRISHPKAYVLLMYNGLSLSPLMASRNLWMAPLLCRKIKNGSTFRSNFICQNLTINVLINLLIGASLSCHFHAKRLKTLLRIRQLWFRFLFRILGNIFFCCHWKYFAQVC